MSEHILEMKGMSKSFPGVQALKKVSFCIRRGSVHGLVGENGAGKSTLMRILSGADSATEGDILIDGLKIQAPTPEKMLRLGIAVIYQELSQAPHLSVAENIFLGRLPRTYLGMIDWGKTIRAATDVLTNLGFDIDPILRLDRLSVAQRQMVEIAKAVSRNARIIVLDEPSAVLGESELVRLFALIRHLAREQGVSFIYISHRLKEIFEICQDVTVLRDGQVISSQPVAQVTTSTLIRQMVGREISNIFPSRTMAEKEVRLSVSRLRRKGVLHDISFDVCKGEIFGICGLAGSGRSEVLRAIYGADPLDDGDIHIDGEKLAHQNPQTALKRGVCLLPEDRKTQGLFLNQSVAFNITISALGSINIGGIIQSARERRMIARLVKQVRIKTPRLSSYIRNLSGGNQQKCSIARQLHAGASILLIDEPTRGVDVAAKREIYDLLVQLTSNFGVSIVMVSSDLPEILGLCHRIAVMRSGRVATIIDGARASEEQLMAHAV